jgi:hypothetical protein
MSLKNLKTAAWAELKKWRTYVSIVLLAALPWAKEIQSELTNSLPALQPYLPDNVYKFMGGAVVVAGMILRLAISFRAVKAANDT